MSVYDINAYSLEGEWIASRFGQYKEWLKDNLEKLLQPMAYQMQMYLMQSAEI
jgi:hypothetical protein